MKKIFILSLIFIAATSVASAQENRRGEFNRNPRIERGFNRAPLARTERFRMEGNRFRRQMAERRLHRYAFMRQRGRIGERRLVARNRFTNRGGRMMLRGMRGHYYNGRRVI